MEKMLFKDFKKIMNKGTYFVAFTAPWCGDCAVMAPVFDNIEFETKEKHPEVRFIQIDAESSGFFRTEDKEFKVARIPAMSMVKDGRVSFIGYERMAIDEIIAGMKL